MNPARNFIARHFIYPMMAHTPALDDINTSDLLFHKACDQATMLVKGGVMVGAGFASHIPIQLAMEGHCDAKFFRQVLMGKSAGLGVSLGSIFLLNSVMPQVLPPLLP